MFRSALTLDIPYARKVWKHLRAHPEEHDQDFFGEKTKCGTRGCIAGTTVLMDPAATVYWDRYGGMESTITVDGQRRGISNRAAELLGLHPFDAGRLFYEWSDSSALTQLQSYIEAAEAAQAE